MVSKKVTLVNPQGFHMRPASEYAGAMAKYQSSVKMMVGDKEVDAKSLMHIMAACIKCGNEVEIICDGPDENEALADAVGRIESGLGDL